MVASDFFPKLVGDSLLFKGQWITTCGLFGVSIGQLCNVFKTALINLSIVSTDLSSNWSLSD